MDRVQARTRWTRWAIAAGISLALAAINPSWIRPALASILLGGGYAITEGTRTWASYHRRWQAFWLRFGDRPAGPAARRMAPVAVQIGTVWLALGGPFQTRPRLQAVTLAVGLAGMTDSTILATLSTAWLAARSRAEVGER